MRLTSRGVTLLVIGLGAVILVAWLGEIDLVWIGLLLLALPLFGLLLVRFMRPDLRVRRTVDPLEVPLGSQAHIALLLENSRPFAMSALSFRDHAPSVFGPDATFSLERGFGRWSQPVGYDLPAVHRGHYQLGPLEATANDPLGLARNKWRVPGDSGTLRITPRVWDLDKLDSSVGLGSAGEATPERIGLAGTDDVLVREHRHGDDLRRVHWRMSAKQGELMVRLEEHPWDPAVRLFLDTRTSAHFGEGPTGTAEWVISLGASVAAKMLAARYRVAITSADGEVMTPQARDSSTARHRMLQLLTDLRLSDETALSVGLSQAGAAGESQSMVAALGMLRAEDAGALVTVSVQLARCSALVPDGAAFGASPDAVRTHDEACRLLEGAGWTVERYLPDDTVPAAWSALVRRELVA